ncbi:MAG: hypothetical protein LAP13_08375 [Acidobacteriia bacterium]|nr:hypothetical protein [Terriglobia bacterium]
MQVALISRERKTGDKVMCGSKFFEVLRQVDEVLGSGPSDENSLRLLGLLRDPATEQYCFDRLDNPNWISPLRSRGFFTKPPSLVRDVSKGTFAFPPWPQSRYLARVAKGSPALVLEVILGIPETDNEIVHVDLVEATLGMPAELAAEWAKTEIAWIERREALYMLLPVKLGALISHLAKGGQGRVALDLARILLAVLPDPRAFEREREFGEKMPELSLPQPRPRFDLWEYGQVLEKNIPDLVAATGEKALWMLCELLRTAVELSRSGKDDKGPYDYSYIWRPEIDRGRSTDDDLKSMLVSAVRDATEEQVRVNPAAIAELAEGLEERGQRWLVFSRLALHVLRMFPAGVADMIEDRLSKPEKYDDPHFHREYRLLLKEHFGKMKSENQERIYAWIEMGPTRKMAEQCKFLGRTATEADITRLSNRWRLERLLPIESYLTGQWKSLYEALVKQLGEPENKDFVQHRISSWSGPTSPKTAQELSQMSFEEIVAFLRQWEPSGEWSASTREGLSRDLTTAVAANPGAVAEVEAAVPLPRPGAVAGNGVAGRGRR